MLPGEEHGALPRRQGAVGGKVGDLLLLAPASKLKAGGRIGGWRREFYEFYRWDRDACDTARGPPDTASGEHLGSYCDESS